MLYDGILDYAPYRSLRAMVRASDIAVLGEVSAWRVADHERPLGAAVMTLRIVRQVRPATRAERTLDIRFESSSQFDGSGEPSLLSIDDKRGADGSFTGARVPRQDFRGWVPRGTAQTEEFATLVRLLQSGV